MDAFVVRRQAPLFSALRCVFVPVGHRQHDELSAAAARELVEQHGGRVADLARVVGDDRKGASTLWFAVSDERLSTHDPTATPPLLSSRWIHDSVAAMKRLPTEAYAVKGLKRPADDANADDSRQVKKRGVDDQSPAADTTSQVYNEDTISEPCLDRPWREVDGGSLYYLDARAVATEASATVPYKIAAFDLDGTLIVTKSGKRFAQDAADWKLFHTTNVVKKLQQLTRQGFLVAVISNQNGVAKGKTTAREVQTKLLAVVKKIGVPAVVLFATKDDLMRKPRNGAWNWLRRELGGGADIEIDQEASFYCGDAAGRPKVTGRNKDFAATDYKFALNIGITFHTPEALFLSSTQRIHTRPELWELDFDPRTLPVKTGDSAAAIMRMRTVDGCYCACISQSARAVVMQVTGQADMLLCTTIAELKAALPDWREFGPRLELHLVDDSSALDVWMRAAVIGHKIIPAALEAAHAVFRVQVRHRNKSWIVWRRFREFVELSESLQSSLGSIIPLPQFPAKAMARRLDDAFLDERADGLHRYLIRVLLIDAAQQSVALLSFLGAVSVAQLRLQPHAAMRQRDVLHLRVLPYYVDAGDILLFRSRGVVSACQRLATFSEWDHVAIVVTDNHKGLQLLLEATGEGVTALPLTSRLFAYSASHADLIALRRLQTPLLTSSVRSDILARFTHRALGKPYGLSLAKVLRTEDTRNSPSSADYFCSELALGLVEARLPSSNFWPSSFSPGAFADMELARHGAALGPEKLFKLSSKFHGQGPVVFGWQPNGGFLATAGKNGLVHIFDRQGEQYDEIGLDMSTPVLALEWDPEGSTLAILQQGSSVVPLWDLATRSAQLLDTNLKDPTFLTWAATGGQLAIGTQKGNLVLYNKSSRKIVPVLGKHSKRITCGAWNAADILVLGSEDRMLTVSNSKGDTIEQRELNLVPVSLKFGRKRGESMKAAQQSVAISVTRSIILFSLQDPANPIELTFQAHYGSIVFFEWFGDGLIMIAFSEGFLIVISTKMDEVGEEIFSGRFFTDRIFAASFSAALNRVAISGDSGIKIIDMAAQAEVTSDAIKLTDAEENEANMMAYTADGQILTVATQGGSIQNFLARMPKVYDHYNNYVAYLSSLRELSVVDVLDRDSPMHIAVSIEPSFVSLGPRHVAVGMNNRVWYYRCDGTSHDALVNEQQYLGRVASVKLNRDYACVLCDGKASLHLIEPGAGGHVDLQEEQGKVFSSSAGGRDERNNEISAIALTKDFFVYATSNGTGAIHFFYLSEWKFLDGCSYRHDDGVGIVQIAPNRDGTRILFLDSRRRGYLLHAPTRDALYVPSIPSTTTSLLWDTVDPNVFVALQPSEFGVYHYADMTVNGPEVTQLGFMEIHNNGEFVIAPQNTPIPPDLSPILICDGVMTCQHATGKLTTLTACTHDQLQKSARAPATGDHEKAMFRQHLSMLHMDAAWKLAVSIDSRDYWLALACRGMHTLDVGVAKRAYGQLGDAGMVLGLDRIEHMEEKNLLAGHISMLFGDYGEARRLLLNSSDPMAALHMQRFLLQWDQALKLADSLAVELVPELSVAYATQLEFRGEFDGALKMYEHATNVTDEHGNSVMCPDKLKQQSLAGIARCTFRLGDLRRGVRLVTEIGDVNVYRECAAILESMKQTTEAAALYEKGEMFEKAAQIYIQMKNLSKAAPLMAKVKTPKIHAQYGRAKEAAGEFSVASKAYEVAGDMDNVVRIQLEHLHQPENAFAIVRETKSSEGALVVAKYCTETGNYRCAIEFLLMANKEDEAFQLAMTQNEVDAFAQQLGESISIERAAKVAQHYEQTQALARAAEFYQICGNYHKALRLFLQCGDSELSKAIDVVGKARNDMLTHTLIDHLMGETDGIPKDPNHIFRLYMALGNYPQAAKTALIISRQEQELGNYKMAHDVLVETHRQLESHKIHVSQELRQSLMLLHSYILVKKLVKRGEHTAAARMLVRVAKHISKFPTHVSNILISAVIECQRAGLRAYSYEYATTLMKPEYRNNIDKEIKRKIEAIVRRPNKEQSPDPVTPCPYCGNELPEADLDCAKCKNWIPYCIVTGYHMVKDDWSRCPTCSFPALFSHFSIHLASDPSCPMCETSLQTDDITRIAENEIRLTDASGDKDTP
ncbi:hypothetical protein ATCC90586_000273 [Pythium insidiosum]|nr:hypothetical protein ATCC90586_000273 [Pythium insidiosum]